MSLKKQLIRSFVGVGAIKLAAIPLSLIVSVVLARSLGAEGFGQYTFIMALVPLLSLPVVGGLPQLLTREVATLVHRQNWQLYLGALRSAHIWVLGSSVTLLVIFWVTKSCMPWPAAGSKWDLLVIAFILLPITALNGVRSGVIKGMGKPAMAELPAQLIHPSCQLIILGLLVFSESLSAANALWAQVGAATVTLFAASFLFYYMLPEKAQRVEPLYELRKWRSALLPFTLLSLVSTFNAQVGIVVLGLLGTDEQVAALRIAEKGAQFVSFFLTLVNMIIAPYIVQAFHEGNRDKLQLLATQAARISFLLSLPIALLLLIAGQELIDWVFGSEYGNAAYFPLVILVIGRLISAFYGVAGQLLLMSGHEMHTLCGLLSAAAISIVLSLLLVPEYGAVGAAVGTSTGVLAWNVVLSALVWRRLTVKSRVF